jgi:FecR protein
MNDDYLWDRSGPPDPEIVRLEKMLAPLGHQAAAALPQAPEAPFQRPSIRWVAAAAAVLIALAGWQMRLAPTAPTGWQISRMDGADVAVAVRAGQVLRTGHSGELSMQAGAVGMLDIGPDSQLRAASSRKMELERGQLHAFIWARPREFVVDTPSARAVDLGCEYTLTVASSGDGLLRVSMGWVAFQSGGQEAFIPAGAQCVTRRRRGPGIPYYEDATAPFRSALAAIETGQEAALQALLSNARARDGLTLWHLLTRVPAADRGRVYDRFAELAPVPPEVTRAAALAKDPHAIDRLWDCLNLENTEWWRGWERPWQQ